MPVAGTRGAPPNGGTRGLHTSRLQRQPEVVGRALEALDAAGLLERERLSRRQLLRYGGVLAGAATASLNNTATNGNLNTLTVTFAGLTGTAATIRRYTFTSSSGGTTFSVA